MISKIQRLTDEDGEQTMFKQTLYKIENLLSIFLALSLFSLRFVDEMPDSPRTF